MLWAQDSASILRNPNNTRGRTNELCVKSLDKDKVECCKETVRTEIGETVAVPEEGTGSLRNIDIHTKHLLRSERVDKNEKTLLEMVK